MSIRPVSSTPNFATVCRLPPDPDRTEPPATYAGIGGGGGRRRDSRPCWELDLASYGDGAGGIRRDDERALWADNQRAVADVSDADAADRVRVVAELCLFGDWAWAIAVDAEANARSAVIARSLRMLMGVHHPKDRSGFGIPHPAPRPTAARAGVRVNRSIFRWATAEFNPSGQNCHTWRAALLRRINTTRPEGRGCSGAGLFRFPFSVFGLRSPVVVLDPGFFGLRSPGGKTGNTRPASWQYVGVSWNEVKGRGG